MQAIRNIFYTQTERTFYEKNFHPRIMNEKNFHKCYANNFYAQTFFMLRHSCCLEKIFTIPVKMKIIFKKAIRNIFMLRHYGRSIIRIDFCSMKIIFNNDPE